MTGAGKAAERAALLAAIAKEHLAVETLSRRNCDDLDFHDLAVWQLKAALEAAFEAGRRGRGGHERAENCLSQRRGSTAEMGLIYKAWDTDHGIWLVATPDSRSLFSKSLRRVLITCPRRL